LKNWSAQLEQHSSERRIAETDAANLGGRLKQMESETQRIERRLQDWTMQAARNKDACEAKRRSIAEKRGEATRLEGEHAQAEAGLDELQTQLSLLRQQREGLQQEAAQATAELAGLEERRRGAEAAFQRIDRLPWPTWNGVCNRSRSKERRLRRRESSALPRARRLLKRQKELADTRTESLALTQTSRHNRWRCVSS